MGGRVGVRLVQFSRNDIRLYLALSINLHKTLTELFQMYLIREAPFLNVLFPYMGIAKIALDPPLCPAGTIEDFFGHNLFIYVF